MEASNPAKRPYTYTTARSFRSKIPRIGNELRLGWYDYGARMLNPAIGRWNGVDALAESQLAFTSYHYAYNNPLIFTDPTGLAPVYQNGTYVGNGDDDDEGREYSWDEVMDYLHESGGVAANFMPNTAYAVFKDGILTDGEQRTVTGRIQSAFRENGLNQSTVVANKAQTEYLNSPLNHSKWMEAFNIADLRFTPNETNNGMMGATPINTSQGASGVSRVMVGEIDAWFLKNGGHGRSGYRADFLTAVAAIGAHELFHLYSYRAYQLGGMSDGEAVPLAQSHLSFINGSEYFSLATAGSRAILAFKWGGALYSRTNQANLFRIPDIGKYQGVKGRIASMFSAASSKTCNCD